MSVQAGTMPMERTFFVRAWATLAALFLAAALIAALAVAYYGPRASADPPSVGGPPVTVPAPKPAPPLGAQGLACHQCR